MIETVEKRKKKTSFLEKSWQQGWVSFITMHTSLNTCILICGCSSLDKALDSTSLFQSPGAAKWCLFIYILSDLLKRKNFLFQNEPNINKFGWDQKVFDR